MSLHNDIMNIQMIRSIESLPLASRINYKSGYRTALEEAADLALTYDNLVGTLERSLEETLAYVGDHTIQTDLEQMLETIQKVKSGEYK